MSGSCSWYDEMLRMGWNDKTQLDLVLEYIETQQSHEAFLDFLKEKRATVGACKHCGSIDCYVHCQESEDGNHVPDARSATVPSGLDDNVFVVDYRCKLCGLLGSVCVQPNDIVFE